MPFLLLFKSPIFRGFILAAIVAALLGWAYLSIGSRFTAACEGEHFAANAAAAEEQHQLYIAAIQEGERISAELDKTQRRLNETKAEYLAYANGISGNCPGDVAAVNNAAATSQPVVIGLKEVSASALAGNIAENYGRANANAAQLSALIDWVNGAFK